MIRQQLFRSVGFVSDSRIFPRLGVKHLQKFALDKSQRCESNPLLLKQKFYEANALPSELAGPGFEKNLWALNMIIFYQLLNRKSFFLTMVLTNLVKINKKCELLKYL